MVGLGYPHILSVTVLVVGDCNDSVLLQGGRRLAGTEGRWSRGGRSVSQERSGAGGRGVRGRS